MNPHYQPHPPMPPHQQPMAPDMGGPPAYHYVHGPPMMASPYYQQNPAPPMQNPNLPLQPSMAPARDRMPDIPPRDAPLNAPSATGIRPEDSSASLPEDTQGTDHEGFTYRLVVVQHPARARMCGFGDKDRRPITPPPCVKLVITDRNGVEVDVGDKSAFYVVHVDLFNAEGTKEDNLIKSNKDNSISSGSVASYRDAAPESYGYGAVLPHGRDPFASSPQSAYPPQMSPYPSDQYTSPGYSPFPQVPQVSSFNQPISVAPQYAGGYTPTEYRPPQMMGAPPMEILPSHGQSRQNSISEGKGHYTRNMIGTCACSAARLIDNHEQPGIWFVLQDLSVRSEGFFRLRFSFINLRAIEAPIGASASDANSLVGRKKKAKILSQAFSDPFQVFSAKKFPGVCDSTPLSKKFAEQGIKIPIRKDGDKDGNSKDDMDD